MEGFIEIEYKEFDFYEYQKDILSMGICKVFIPMGFINSDGKEIAVYNTDKYLPITMINRITGAQALRILYTLIDGMKKAESHCIYMDDYKINPEYVSVKKDDMSGGILFSPNKYSRGNSNNLASIKGIVIFLGRKVIKKDLYYLNQVINIIENKYINITALSYQLKRLYYIATIEDK